MMRAILNKSLYLLFLLSICITSDIYSAAPDHDDSHSFYYHWNKSGAGKTTAAPSTFADSTPPRAYTQKIPVVTAEDFTTLFTTQASFKKVYESPDLIHVKGCFPMVSLSPTESLAYELIQLGLLPQIDTKTMRLSKETSPFVTGTEGCNHMFASMKAGRDAIKDPKKKKSIPQVKPVTEQPIVMDIFLPKNRTSDSGAVLSIPGSKGARHTEFVEAMAIAKRGVMSVVLNLIGSENLSIIEHDPDHRSHSSIDDQTAESFLSRGLQIMTTHYLLQNITGINPKKIVWNAASIGTTYMLAACQLDRLNLFTTPFIAPSYMRIEDFAPMLVLEGFKDSFFWTTPKRIIHGDKDGFTPHSQTEAFLTIHRPSGVDPSLTIIDTHPGNHDTRALPFDMPHHKGQSYHLDGPNYAGLLVAATSDLKSLRVGVAKHLSSDDAQKISDPVATQVFTDKAKITNYGIELLRSKLLDLQKQQAKALEEMKLFISDIKKTIKNGSVNHGIELLCQKLLDFQKKQPKALEEMKLFISDTKKTIKNGSVNHGIERLCEKLLELQEKELAKAQGKIDRFVPVAKRAVKNGSWALAGSAREFDINTPITVTNQIATVEVTDILKLFTSLCRGETFGSDSLAATQTLLRQSVDDTVRHAGGRAH